MQRILDSLTDAPASVSTPHRDLVVANALGREVYSPLFDDVPDGIPNTARLTFLAPGAREFFIDWHRAAANVVANLRRELGADPLNRDLHALIEDLNRNSPQFRELWQSHDVRSHDTGMKPIRHPLVGELHLTFETMPLPTDPGQTLVVYGPEPGSDTADRLGLLTSWTATLDALSSNRGLSY